MKFDIETLEKLLKLKYISIGLLKTTTTTTTFFVMCFFCSSPSQFESFCMDLAIKKAKTVGVGWVCANNSNHYGNTRMGCLLKLYNRTEYIYIYTPCLSMHVYLCSFLFLI